MTNDEVYATQAKRHAETMDALHTIGRNIAQSDAAHRRIALVIEGIGIVITSFGGVFVVLAMIAISMVLR